MQKSSIDSIRQNFNGMVDRFTNIETGQATAIDSPLCMEIVAQTAKALCPEAQTIMDLGCGGGNYAVKMCEVFPNADCTLIDLSENMIREAERRVSAATKGAVKAICADYKNIDFGYQKFDVITAGTTLHHLRTAQEWESVFGRVYDSLKRGGLFFVNDIVIGETPEIDALMLEGWKSVLRQNVPGEVDFFLKKYETEDTPQTLNYQLDLMREVGFSQTSVLHKHFNFATFVGVKYE
ncbi:MAG: class I SAM-dependent methyltransferase [Salinivirgaceae bacterium]|nr:class I SAM-dependent methyltransferase [Salinivirgaceae bacterium]